MSKKQPITRIKLTLEGNKVTLQGRGQSRRGRGFVVDHISAAAHLMQRQDRAKTLEKMINALVDGKPVDSQ